MQMSLRDIQAPSLPLTYSQQSIWSHQQKAPNSFFYNTSIAIRILSELNVDALHRTFHSILERHAVLRTVVGNDAGQPVQQIVDDSAVAFQWLDATGWDEEKLRAEITQAHRLRYEFAQGPLFRVHLFSQAPDRHVLLMGAHHLVIDATSWLQIFTEIGQLYPAVCRGLPTDLPVLTTEYMAYARQEQRVLDQRGEKLRAYWQSQLNDLPLQLDLPTDYSRASARQFGGESEFFALSPELMAALRRLAKQEKLTINVLFLSAFQILLYRYSQQERFLIGIPSAYRPAPEFETVVGNFVNLLPIGADLRGNPTVIELFRQVWRAQTLGLKNQAYPFSLIQTLATGRTAAAHAVVQVIFNFPQSPSRSELAPFLLTIPGTEEAITPLLWGEMSVLPYGLPQQEGGFDLGLEMVETAQGCVGVFKYSTNLFQAATVRRMSAQLQTLLGAIAADPYQHIAQLPLLTDAEYHQLVHTWNQSRLDFGPPQTIHAIFEQQVVRTPNAVALVLDTGTDAAEQAQGHRVTYDELNTRANQLAHRLIEHGVKTDTFVAVMMERSLEMIISLLAVLKAGGAYVPIDPTYPAARIRYMLADSGAAILLTQSHLLPHNDVETVIAVDTMAPHLALQPVENPRTPTAAADLAYVIYTSGTTGQPKGVLLEHGGAFNVAAAQATVLPELTTGSRLLQLAALGFDAATAEIMMALMHGVTLVLAPAHHERLGAPLADLLRRQRISHVTLVPSAIQTLPDVDLPDLKVLITAGEACPDEIVKRWAKGRAFFNFYGPTESPIWTTYAQLQPDDKAHIGRPIPNRRVYLLDANGAVVPVGVPGELYIGGDQLARGYLNRPDLTAERFVEHPHFGRLYRTGDLCRWSATAGDVPQIEYLGRTDFQVKLHGFRIELSEIENALRAATGVEDAVVLLREDQPGHKRLVAYLVGAVEPDALREHLAQRLPEYMLPAAIVTLASMPLTPNGKLDRHALPTPDYVDTGATFSTPRNGVEAALTALFADVLGVEQVGIGDNFFRLGGDSILCIQLVSKAAQIGYDISVSKIFQYPIVEDLAAHIGAPQAPAGERADAAQTAPDEELTGAAPLLPIQHWFLNADQPAMQHFNQTVLLQVKQPIDLPTLDTAIQTLLRRHDALRFHYRRDADGWQQQYSAPGADVPLAIVDLQSHGELRPAAIDAIAERAQTTLNPLTGDLARFVYFRTPTGAGEHLLMIIHHLAVDGVSWRILLEDLTTLLDGGSLPPKTNSYRDWGEALQAATRDGRFAGDIARWLDATDTPLPLDDPGAANTFGTSHTVTFTLDAARTEHLRRTLPNRHNVTLDAVLLTALTETVAAWSGHTALRVKMESHGRQPLFENLDLSRTVGWFTSAYPLTVPRFDGSALRRIRYTLALLRDVPEGGLSFGALQHFHPAPDLRNRLADLPPAPVVYNYLGQLDTLDNARFGVGSGALRLSAAPDMRRDSLIDSNAVIVNGRLQIEWTVSPQIHHATAQSLLASFAERLDTLLDAALASDEYIAIPSDFPDADLSLAQLETLTEEIGDNLETIFGLSPMQAGMLFHSQMAPDNGTYIEHELRHVDDARFDVDRFVAAFQEAIHRHDSLRASFHAPAVGEPIQVIHRRVTLPITRLDWRDLSAAAYQTRLSQWVARDRVLDFDLAQAPLLRLAVIQRAQHGYDLLFTFHHILLDRWSVDLFWNAVQQAYASPPLSTTTSYQAYIHHLRQQSADQSFWRNYLRGFCAPTPLPGITKTTKAAGKPATITQSFTQEESGQLAAFARDQGLTLNILFQAAWALLLARYTRETDIVFGMVSSGRTAPIPGIETMSGLLINTLPFRVQLNGALTGAELLQQVAQTQHQLQQREHTALVNVQQWSEVPAGTGLFDSLLLFQNTPQAAVADPTLLQLRPGHVEPGDTGYGLVALVTPGTSTKLMLNYDTTRYDADTIERLLMHWQQLVIGLVTEGSLGAEQPVLQLPMLTAAEYDQIVHEWNNTSVDFGVPQTIHALFEQQVERTPDAVALVIDRAIEGQDDKMNGISSHLAGTPKMLSSCQPATLTYAELNARANQLAYRLIELGVAADTPVAVAMERSAEMVVSLLAVLKAGGAYVPIDPTYPSERIRYMLTDSGAPILLTQSHLVVALETAPQIRHTIAVDTVMAELASQPTENPQTSTTPENLVYVIYTSGSTGQPKGTANQHDGVFNRLRWTQQQFQLTAQDRVLQKTPFSFDVSVWEFFWTLMSGACLVVARPEGHKDPSYLCDIIQREQITLLHFVPSMLRQFITDPRIQRCISLRYILTSGEALPLDLAQATSRLLPHAALHNLYGPTEAAVDVSHWAYCEESHTVPIGKPIANTTLYVLNESKQVIPIGVAGELYIGGVQLARGYLNRPDLTSERFIEHPCFGRLYKTGDLCRWLTDGNIEYLGRTDFQVKLRGFRIELGEIERVLLAQPGVHDALVLAREDGSPLGAGDKQLVAYVVAKMAASDHLVTTAALRRALAHHLPEYMIPAAFVFLDAMPLNPNGKIDRRALPAPDRTIAQQAFVPPRNPLEEQLAEIWRTVLRIEQVGIHDNFFDLGGHSLLATRIASQIRTRFQVDLPIRTMFETTDFAELANVVAISTNRRAATVEFDEQDEEF